MSKRYRVVSEQGLRVITARGAYSLPPGTVLEELPEHYEGELEELVTRRVHEYADKRIRPAEDKSA